MPYIIYGKITKEYKDSLGTTHQPTPRFAPLDYAGCRVTKLEDAGTYATKEDAEETLAKKADPNADYFEFQVRKAK